MNPNYENNLISGNPKNYKNRPTWKTLKIFYKVREPITIVAIAKGLNVSYNHAWQYINNLLKTKKIKITSDEGKYPKTFEITEWGIKYYEYRIKKEKK